MIRVPRLQLAQAHKLHVLSYGVLLLEDFNLRLHGAPRMRGFIFRNRGPVALPYLDRHKTFANAGVFRLGLRFRDSIYSAIEFFEKLFKRSEKPLL